MSENDPKMEIKVTMEGHEGVEENVDVDDSSFVPALRRLTDFPHQNPS
jgi:hypothetical protein